MPQITEDLLNQAAKLAARLHDDEWFAIDVSMSGKSSEPGTIIVEHENLKFEVWLTKYWRKTNNVV
jgi:hypothetical protein